MRNIYKILILIAEGKGLLWSHKPMNRRDVNNQDTSMRPWTGFNWLSVRSIGKGGGGVCKHSRTPSENAVGLEVLTAGSMNKAVFWFLAPCSLLEVCRRVRGACCLHHLPGNGGSEYLWNIGELLPYYTALQTRRQLFSLGNFLTNWATSSFLERLFHAVII
jgi:hypothetical protein